MIWKVVSPCIEESRFLVWSWWGLCKKKGCLFELTSICFREIFAAGTYFSSVWPFNFFLTLSFLNDILLGNLFFTIWCSRRQFLLHAEISFIQICIDNLLTPAWFNPQCIFFLITAKLICVKMSSLADFWVILCGFRHIHKPLTPNN